MKRILLKRILLAAVCALTLLGQVRIPGPGAMAPAGGAPDTHLRIDTFIADGTWTAPAGVTSVLVEAWGSGGDGVTNTGAGGGGEYCKKTVTVVPTTGYAVDVGTGGGGAVSTFDTTTVVANGGSSGTTSAGGTGGTGDTCFNGGNGSNGTGNRGGGGGAGNTAVGANSTGNAAAFGGNYFGGPSGVPGVVGLNYSSGGYSQTASAVVGRNGFVRVSYQIAPGTGFPVVLSYAYGRSAADATSHTINLPTCASGKTLIVFFSVDGEPALSDYTGWTNVVEAARSGAVKGLVLEKTSTGSDTLAITSDAAQESVHVSACLSGVAGTIDGTGASAFSTSVDPPSYTHASSTNALWFAFAAVDLAGGTAFTAFPSSYADAQVLTPQHTGQPGVALSTRHVQTDAENPGAFTVSASSNSATATICIPGT